MNAFVRLERLIETLIEKPFGRLFGANLHPADLTKALLRALSDNCVSDGRGGYLPPNRYELVVSVSDYQHWQTNPGIESLIEDLKRALNSVVAEMTDHSTTDFQIKLVPQTNFSSGKVGVTSYHAVNTVSSLADKRLIHDTQPLEQFHSISAEQYYLHFETSRIQLGMPIIRIGRAADNDIVLAEPNIAKYHAQLRWRNKQYYAQNLSQSLPLFINERLVRQSRPLQPGDRIRLGQCVGIFQMIPHSTSSEPQFPPTRR